jgi:hypothetical protein
MKASNSSRLWKVAALGFSAMIAAGATGCQVDVGGQTLPSPYYLEDDVQYFAPGHKFKLQNEADAQALYRANQAQLRGARP